MTRKYRVARTKRFRKEVKSVKKRGYNLMQLDMVVDMLASGKKLSRRYKDHALTGDWEGFRECHIAPDWLLVYMIENDILVLTLTRTGTHSDIF